MPPRRSVRGREFVRTVLKLLPYFYRWDENHFGQPLSALELRVAADEVRAGVRRRRAARVGHPIDTRSAARRRVEITARARTCLAREAASAVPLPANVAMQLEVSRRVIADRLRDQAAQREIERKRREEKDMATEDAQREKRQLGRTMGPEGIAQRQVIRDALLANPGLKGISEELLAAITACRAKHNCPPILETTLKHVLARVREELGIVGHKGQGQNTVDQDVYHAACARAGVTPAEPGPWSWVARVGGNDPRGVTMVRPPTTAPVARPPVETTTGPVAAAPSRPPLRSVSTPAPASGASRPRGTAEPTISECALAILRRLRAQSTDAEITDLAAACVDTTSPNELDELLDELRVHAARLFTYEDPVRGAARRLERAIRTLRIRAVAAASGQPPKPVLHVAPLPTAAPVATPVPAAAPVPVLAEVPPARVAAAPPIKAPVAVPIKAFIPAAPPVVAPVVVSPAPLAPTPPTAVAAVPPAPLAPIVTRGPMTLAEVREVLATPVPPTPSAPPEAPPIDVAVAWLRYVLAAHGQELVSVAVRRVAARADVTDILAL